MKSFPTCHIKPFSKNVFLSSQWVLKGKNLYECIEKYVDFEKKPYQVMKFFYLVQKICKYDKKFINKSCKAYFFKEIYQILCS